jgi:hypothetical protein
VVVVSDFRPRDTACKRTLTTLFVLLGLTSSCSTHRVLPPNTVVFSGMCDASGAVPWSQHSFAVADDEDNVIRIYDVRRGGAPLRSFDLSPELDLPRKRRKAAPETDIEAATRVGELAYWITSHGRSASGKEKLERHRFFATRIARAQGSRPSSIEVVGRAYQTLLDDLVADPRYAAFGLAEASTRAPKSPGGLNIEGLTARAEGGVLIGFRSPVPAGKALIAPLLNPEEVVLGREAARFGSPIELELGGLGIRGLSSWRGRYLILAGDTGSERPSQLFVWDGRVAPQRVEIDLKTLNPEGFFSPDQDDRVLLLSDDGTVEQDGVACKDLEHPRYKSFRATWIAGSVLPR